MSSKLMDTSPGGENTQYESIKTVTKEHSKENGQFSSTSTDRNTNQDSTTSARGAQTAENVRYGQAMSEQGFGGFTAPAHNDGAVGGGSNEDAGQMRREQGYTAGQEMDRKLGG